MLKGTELLDTIRTMETASRTEQCLACGYVRENGKPAFTAFYEAILEARGVTTAAVEKEELLTEYPDQKDTLAELLEDMESGHPGCIVATAAYQDSVATRARPHGIRLPLRWMARISSISWKISRPIEQARAG